MCGLAGIVLRNENDERIKMALPMLALFMETRGNHSWGWTDGNEIIKDTGAISKGFNPSLYRGKQILLHTRFGTTGSHTKENSHPWKFGEGENAIIGAHNGTLNNHDELNKKYDRKFEVDSQHIFQHILEKRDLNEIKAYGTIIYIQNGTMFFCRFNAGALAIAETDLGLVFASTEEAVRKSCDLSGIKIKQFFEIVDSELFYAKEGTLWTTKNKLDFGSKYAGFGKSYSNWSHGHTQGYYGKRQHYDNRSNMRGRWDQVEQKWIDGKYVDGIFVEGTWKGNNFQPDKESLRDWAAVHAANKSKSSSKTTKKDRKKESKIVVINPVDSDAEACAKCGTVFAIEEDTWDTPIGELCDGCANESFNVADVADVEEVKTIENDTPIHNVETTDNDGFTATTVQSLVAGIRQKTVHAAGVDEQTGMVPCDECERTLAGAETIYICKVGSTIDKEAKSTVSWILCPTCHVELTTPAFKGILGGTGYN